MDDENYTHERIIYTSSSNPGFIIGGFILGIGATCAVLTLYFNLIKLFGACSF